MHGLSPSSSPIKRLKKKIWNIHGLIKKDRFTTPDPRINSTKSKINWNELSKSFCTTYA